MLLILLLQLLLAAVAASAATTATTTDAAVAAALALTFATYLTVADVFFGQKSKVAQRAHRNYEKLANSHTCRCTCTFSVADDG